MRPEEKEELIVKLEGYINKRREMLKQLKIAERTYHRWRSKYSKQGVRGLQGMKTMPHRVWNRLTEEESKIVLEEAMKYPELTPRLIAIEITDISDRLLLSG